MANLIKNAPSRNRHLKLLTEADRGRYEGPITRLGLWYRFQDAPRWQLGMMVTTKLILLSTILYMIVKFKP